MTLTFELLSPQTLEAAADIWTEGWTAGHADIVPAALIKLRTAASFRDRLEKHQSDTWVAMRGGVVQGFYIRDKDQLYQFYVSSTARGSGVAAKMMDHAENTFRAAGISKLWLACSVGNDRAARFYEKTGWRNVRTESFPADTADGPFDLNVWRFEKLL